MGLILSKFRKEKTTYQILESLEDEIKTIEEYSLSTQARQKRYVGNFLVISIGLYVIGFIVFYFAFFPPTWMERITYSIPLLIFPMLIFFLKRLVAWYFQRKLNKNASKLDTYRAKKRKMIEEVMNKETYKVALEILNRFADKSNGFKPTINTTAATPRQLSTPVSTYQSKQITSFNVKQQSAASSPLKLMPELSNTLTTITPQKSNFSSVPSSGTLTQRRNIQSLQSFRKRTPYPIVNQQTKGVLEKMVDYLIGDGPNNRFAMICKECFAHNGMALQEEYDYAAFRCAFCNTMNPSRKSRPKGPKLPTHVPTHGTSSADIVITQSNNSSSTSTSEKESSTDSDLDEKKDKMKIKEDYEDTKEKETEDNCEEKHETTEKIDEHKKND